MGKKKNKTTTQEEPMDTVDLTDEETTGTLELRAWDEDFGDSDHKHYMQMSAEAIQAAGNVALADRDAEKLLVTAEQWGRLARLRREMDATPSRRTGFFDEEED